VISPVLFSSRDTEAIVLLCIPAARHEHLGVTATCPFHVNPLKAKDLDAAMSHQGHHPPLKRCRLWLSAPSRGKLPQLVGLQGVTGRGEKQG